MSDILKGVIKTNNSLYDLCQFQHCDMKCKQILLTKDRPPIISDFDKSTFTIKFEGTYYRIRLVKEDSSGQANKYRNPGYDDICFAADENIGHQESQDWLAVRERGAEADSESEEAAEGSTKSSDWGAARGYRPMILIDII